MSGILHVTSQVKTKGTLGEGREKIDYANEFSLFHLSILTHSQIYFNIVR